MFMDGLTPLPTASSSLLARRWTTGVQQARNDAVRSPYHSPHQHRLQRSPGWSPLQDVSNIPRPQIQNPVAGPSVEDVHSGFREAPRNENRMPSPTPSASQGAQSTSLRLGTPLDSQHPILSARTLAQCEHEAAAKATGASTNRPPRPAPCPVGADGPGQLSVGQQACRQNERNDYDFLIPLHETVYPEVDSIASTPDNDNGKPLEPEVRIPKINTEYLPYAVFFGLPFNGNKDKGMFDINIGQYTQLSKVVHLLCCLPPV
ncbi:hypothetical protein B0H13DRAFT_2428228 [Mycena leptocephala]|nr:hypothetical protein B0H13DRAFT_2428228 [Mycena leptocephala]